jgi:signal transduction histidine kinase/ActR/RegA family two-component response regulator
LNRKDLPLLEVTRPERTVAVLKLMLVLAVLMPAALFAYLTLSNLVEIRQKADQDLVHIGDLAEAYSLRIFQTIELGLNESQEILRTRPDEQIRAGEASLHERLRGLARGLPQLDAVWAFDKDGRPLVSSSVFPVPPTLNNSDRDYFQAQVAGLGKLYVGKVVTARVGQFPIFTMSRPRASESENFSGVVAAAIKPDVLVGFFRQLAKGEDQFVALIREDGTFLARYPEDPAAFSTRTSNVFGQERAQNATAGTYTSVSPVDRREKRVAYRKITGYPVYVLAGQPSSIVWDELKSNMLGHLAFGTPVTLLLIALSYLALVRTRDFLAGVEQREKMEDALRQAQKMESLGQLTGGIAHDFNNLLTGIIGSLDLLQSRLNQGRTEGLQRYLSSAMTSANRAAALTHRLLAFARRQPLDPKPVNAAELVTSFEEMLHRTIGENIELVRRSDKDLWLTRCDPHQLESAILNLAINARDAMPDGGKLRIETGNAALREGDPVLVRTDAAPGEYVRVSVRDSGAGMSPDVIARAFDPFFTTKPLGQGTGLGLSMVYGFVRQSHGFVRIESSVGEGTNVEMYLPRHLGQAAEDDVGASAGGGHHDGTGQAVLVVEDELIVRRLVVEVLEDVGYRVLEAEDGPSGLAILESNEGIDLLVSDVGLPGLNGRQLADRARETRPHLKVLFITGYAENATLASGFLEPGMEMITKPFAVETLANKVQEMLRAGTSNRAHAREFASP